MRRSLQTTPEALPANFLDVGRFMNLCQEFSAPSWNAWRILLAQVLTSVLRELYVIAGRGCGKSRIAGVLGAMFGSRTYRHAPGELIYVGIFAPDRKQARITFMYLCGLFRAVPALAALVVNDTRESLELSTGVVIEVLTASKAAPRGRAYALVIIEEAAFLPTDESANPDVELLRAVRPALARVPGSLLIVITSPYAKRGIAYEALRRYGDGHDPAVRAIQKPTLDLNSTFDAAAIERAYQDDPISAASEYGAQFRSDVETFIAVDVIDAAADGQPAERPPQPDVDYLGASDMAGGSGADSATAAVAHAERDRLIVDAVLERRPPFSPEQTIKEFAEFFARYGITRIVGDRWAGEFPREQFAKHGIAYVTAERTTSDTYRELLPELNSGRVDLVNLSRLRAQLVGLERHAGRSGRDFITHAPGGHDDLATSVALAVLEANATTNFGDEEMRVRMLRSGQRKNDALSAEEARNPAEDDEFEPAWDIEDVYDPKTVF